MTNSATLFMTTPPRCLVSFCFKPMRPIDGETGARGGSSQVSWFRSLLPVSSKAECRFTGTLTITIYTTASRWGLLPCFIKEDAYLKIGDHLYFLEEGLASPAPVISFRPVGDSTRGRDHPKPPLVGLANMRE